MKKYGLRLVALFVVLQLNVSGQDKDPNHLYIKQTWMGRRVTDQYGTKLNNYQIKNYLGLSPDALAHYKKYRKLIPFIYTTAGVGGYLVGSAMGDRCSIKACKFTGGQQIGIGTGLIVATGIMTRVYDKNWIKAVNMHNENLEGQSKTSLRFQMNVSPVWASIRVQW